MRTILARTKFAFACGAVAASLALTAAPAAAYHETLRVTVNGVLLSPAQIVDIERRHGIRMQSGDYWYDQGSGFWGRVGGGPIGRIAPQQGGGQQRTITQRYGSWYTDIWR